MTNSRHRAGRHRAGVFFAIVTAMFLGVITTQAKFVYQHGGNALTLMTVRFAVTSLVVGLILLVLRMKRGSDAGNKNRSENTKLTIITGATWSLAMICYLLSVQYMSVSIAALVLFTFPLMILLVSLFLGTIRFSWILLSLFVMAFIGLGFALLSGQLVSNPLGIGLALLAAVGACITFFTGARVSQQVDPLTLVFQVSIIGLILAVPLVWQNFSLPDAAGYLPLAGATTCYILAIICQFNALGRLAPAMVGFVMNLEPVISILAARVMLHETLGTLQWLGIAMVLAALFLSAKLLTPQPSN